MEQKDVVKFCKDLGCCDACCIRYLELKNPSSYENVQQFVHKNLDSNLDSKQINNTDEVLGNNLSKTEVSLESDTECIADTQNIQENMVNNTDSHTLDDSQICKNVVNNHHDRDDNIDFPPAKRIKLDNVCVSCLGVLQEGTWPEAFAMVQEVLSKKRYECETVACALSSPIVTILRERAITLHLEQAFPGYDHKTVMPLKEAWKWLFGRRLATLIGKQLDSGAVAPLLVTVNMEYPDDLQELEILKTLSPALFESRSKQRRRFAVEFTRRVVEQALGEVSLSSLTGAGWASVPSAPVPARAVSVQGARAPLYLGGRYVKLSRTLPQTPWLVEGRRMMHSSVQELICEQVGELYGLSEVETSQQLKFIAAGREDVDVRCLGTGRPFALEIGDPRREPLPAELERVCEEISAGGKIIVRRLVPVSRDALALLKQGEQTKCKTYEALCMKLGAKEVTPCDIERINSYRNTPPDSEARVLLSQRTPIRVLHRRPLLARWRRLFSLNARAVPDAPTLFVVRVRTEAGTYVKEWAHGELGRTRPALGAALGAPADILALDVADVELPWPPHPSHTDAQ